MSTNNFLQQMSQTPLELANELSMYSKKYLLVEGESDKFFWRKIQNNCKQQIEVLVATKSNCNSNKEYVVSVINILNHRDKKNVFGIVDFDFDFIDNQIIDIENLFYYKYHDLEITLLYTKAFDVINDLISSKNKKIKTNDLIVLLLQRSYILGIFRYINYKSNFSFAFDDIEIKKIIDTKTLEQNEKNVIQYLFSRFRVKKEQAEKIRKDIIEIKAYNYPWEYFCNGHDVLKILSCLTKQCISNDNPIKHTEEIISNYLILSHEEIKLENIEEMFISENEIIHFKQ